jgi:AcrR family transcriptional regulator
MEPTAEIPAEERIKKAAKLIFTRKGFAATTIRDIAAEAGINLASINYYFRSKEKLFGVVMAETLDQLFSELEPVLYNASLTLVDKIKWMADHYINVVLKDRDLPFFLVKEVMAGSNQLPMIRNLPALMNSSFAIQLRALQTEGKIQYDPLHIILNMGSMLMMPFLTLQQIKTSVPITEEEFIKLMNERRTLIPMWIGQMIGVDC